MLPDILILYIVLAPGLVALTGLLHKQIGDKIVMSLTSAVVLSAGALSLFQLFAYVAGIGGHSGAEEHHASLVAATTGHVLVSQRIVLFTQLHSGATQELRQEPAPHGPERQSPIDWLVQSIQALHVDPESAYERAHAHVDVISSLFASMPKR